MSRRRTCMLRRSDMGGHVSLSLLGILIILKKEIS